MCVCVCVFAILFRVQHTSRPFFVHVESVFPDARHRLAFHSRRAAKLHAFTPTTQHGSGASCVGNRRAAWRITSSVKLEGNEQPAVYATEYVVKVEAELPEVRDGIFALMDKNLIPSASAGESHELYFKMKGDYCRYVERMVAMPVQQVMD